MFNNHWSRRVFAPLMLIALLGAACGGSATTTISEPTTSETTQSTESAEAVESAPEPTPEPQPTEAPAPEPTEVPEPTPTPEPTAEPVVTYYADDLEVGECIMLNPDAPLFTPAEEVDCNDLHDEEVYARATLDEPVGAAYPGEDAFLGAIAADVCDAAELDFAGAAAGQFYMSSWVNYPLEEEWEAGDRNVFCTVGSPEAGTLKIGTAAGGSIVSTDVVLARKAISSDGVDFNDWVLMTQYDDINTLGSLSDGQFDLPLRRPFAIPFGFIFQSTLDDDHETNTWGYNWLDAEFTDLSSILPGYEISGLSVVGGTTIFAARATPGDDLDIYTTASGSAEVLFGGEGDQRFPSITPDGSRVVFHNDGDLWVADLDGANATALTSGPSTDWESAISPDGQTVLFASTNNGNDDIWAVGIDGGEPVNLTNHPADEYWPTFSEDGSQIFFVTDRLFPEDDRGSLMVMNADGTNPSWFGATAGSHPLVVPRDVADQVYANAPTLEQRYSGYATVTGESGSVETVSFVDGRVSVELPVGWQYEEFENGFLAAPDPDAYYDTWASDGVFALLYDGETQDDFFSVAAASQAVDSCDPNPSIEANEAVTDVGDNTLAYVAERVCSNGGAEAVVIAFYDTATQVGIVIEAQRDNLPDAVIDTVVLEDIVRSIRWN